MKTKIINLYAGPGRGKSTLAAGIFHELKKRGYEAELVTEAAKDWAWADRPIVSVADSIAVVTEQINREARLLGKVEFLISDSPLGIAAFFSKLGWAPNSVVVDLVIAFEKYKIDAGILSYDFLVNKTVKFNPNGRFQKTAADSNKLHKKLSKFLSPLAPTVLRNLNPKFVTEKILCQTK